MKRLISTQRNIPISNGEKAIMESNMNTVKEIKSVMPIKDTKNKEIAKNLPIKTEKESITEKTVAGLPIPNITGWGELTSPSAMTRFMKQFENHAPSKFYSNASLGWGSPKNKIKDKVSENVRSNELSCKILENSKSGDSTPIIQKYQPTLSCPTTPIKSQGQKLVAEAHKPLIHKIDECIDFIKKYYSEMTETPSFNEETETTRILSSENALFQKNIDSNLFADIEATYKEISDSEINDLDTNCDYNDNFVFN